MTLTREEILKEPPGIKLDQWVSVHVMGFEIRKEYLRDQSFYEFYYREGFKFENVHYPDEWQPSRFISAAWEVVKNNKRWFSLQWNGLEFICEIGIDSPSKIGAPEAPEAICKAALLAVLNL